MKVGRRDLTDVQQADLKLPDAGEVVGGHRIGSCRHRRGPFVDREEGHPIGRFPRPAL
jgi:hypothetical protein